MAWVILVCALAAVWMLGPQIDNVMRAVARRVRRWG